MPYAPFHVPFPEIAKAETRSLIAFNHPKLPPAEYGLVELYCDERDCDCRRVFLEVFRLDTKTSEATVAYGWAPRDYYVKWMGDDDRDSIEHMMGPVLNLGSPRTSLSEVLLEEVKVVLQDKAYVERLKRHYAMFRETVERQGKTAPIVSEPKVGRNDACPCGSGKKFKKCHGQLQ